jgi:hypothetical protein
LSKASIEKRIGDLESRVFRYAPAPDPEKVMRDIIFEEWRRGLDSSPGNSDRETVGRAWDDLVRRLKECPVTAESGSLIERYREVLIDEVLRSASSPPTSSAEDYEEAEP